MKFPCRFYRLPLRFDVARLQQEVDALGDDDWLSHPSGFKGNSAVPLVSPGGTPNDGFAGQMAMTPALRRCPYIVQIIASFNVVLSRSRLMRIAPREQVPRHSDSQHHWWSRMRIHVPVFTAPAVKFYCEEYSVHMAAGEAWTFDNWRPHHVENDSDEFRVHLVIDTVGSSAFQQVLERSWRPVEFGDQPEPASQLVSYQPNVMPPLQFERYNRQTVMPPGELDGLVAVIVNDILPARTAENSEAIDRFVRHVDRFRWDWRAVWSVHGEEPAGLRYYQQLRQQLNEQLKTIQGLPDLLSNGTGAQEALLEIVLRPAFVLQAENPVSQ